MCEKEAKQILRKGSVEILHFVREYIEESTAADSLLLNGLIDLNNMDIQDPAIQKLLGEFKDIFQDELPAGLPPKWAVDHAIDTGSEPPVNKNAYPLSVQQLKEQAKQVKSLLQ